MSLPTTENNHGIRTSDGVPTRYGADLTIIYTLLIMDTLSS